MKITIDLPKRSAERLLHAYEAGDPELLRFLGSEGPVNLYRDPSGHRRFAIQGMTISGIDILAPGRCITIPYIAQQVWLQARARRLVVTEVYDFLLRADDGEPLNSFLITTPHFCRRLCKDGSWQDTVRPEAIGDARTGWGWFYYGDSMRDDKQRLLLRVPSTTSFGPDVLELRGHDPACYEVRWVDGLNDSVAIDLFREMRISVYEIMLAEPLKAQEQMWFRLIIEPELLGLPEPTSTVQQSLLDWFAPTVSVAAGISSPQHVRRLLAERLDDIQRRFPERRPEIHRLRIGLLSDRCAKAGTSTRIEDHRVMLAAPTIQINPQTMSSTLPYLGAQSFDCHIPELLHGLRARGRSLVSIIHHWAGGSVVNAGDDLIAVAKAYIEEAHSAPKSTAHLVQSITPDKFREGCFLAGKMCEIGLLHDAHGALIRNHEMTEDEMENRLCLLRRIYADPRGFVDFPQAQYAFGDFHPFGIQLTCSWITHPTRRLLVLNALLGLSLVGFVLGVVNLLM